MLAHEHVRSFIRDMTECVVKPQDETARLARARQLMGALIARDDWLPDEFAAPHPQHYQQYLLYCDPLERFSLASFVWGPGHSTPIHNHTVWGLIGMLRGSEISQRFEPSGEGQPMRALERIQLREGDMETVSPSIGDIHSVENAYTDRVSVSIHLYGGNIGAIRRKVFDAQTGATKAFISGYASPHMPNFWDRSHD
jgi:3-mercaptopropionate dioxygenase